MMNMRCHTNLDIAQYEQFPTELPCRPVVGDKIYSKVKHKNGVCVDLRVSVVSFKHDDGHLFDEAETGWYCEVELTIPERFKSIHDFYTRFYEPLTGRKLI